jgi:hypothetical protein
MPLRARKPPEAVSAAAAAHVYQAAEQPGAFPALAEVDRASLSLVAPHRVFTLGVEGILSAGLRGAEPSGWRFLVADSNHVVASAELADDDGAVPSVNAGPYVAATARVIGYLEERSEIAEGNFEFSILKVPALYVVAAWLVDAHRIVVPLAPTPSFLEAGALYGEGDFSALLTEPAHRIAEEEGGPSGG